MNARRQFLGWSGRLAAALALARTSRSTPAAAAPDPSRVDFLVIGSGFGGSMTSLYITYVWEALHASGAAATQAPLKVLLLERGTWWTTPVETVQDKEIRTRELLLTKGEPTQEWSTANDLRGTLDLLERCRRSDSRPQGLYDFTTVGQRGLRRNVNDGVSVLRASGVGGGSLVYSNITVRPPETLFQDPRWPGVWSTNKAERDRLYALARNAIGYSVQYALEASKPNADPAVLRSTQVNTGLSKIVTRSARLKPSWNQNFQIIVPTNSPPVDPHPAELIDRARVFQVAASQMGADSWGAVDLAINDIAPDGMPEKLRGRNYCERQGRCNVGCLPGARHTLNKQIMRALYGTFDANKPITAPTDSNPNPKAYLRHVNFDLWTLTDVDYISALPSGGYRIHYQRGNVADPRQRTAGIVDATRVIVAAGCLGTTELMLRSDARAKQTNGQEGLRGLSGRLGSAFSTNGDYIAFLTPTREHINLTRGPVTTSFAHFGAAAPRAEGFVNVEDQGIPRALAGLTGYGVPIMQALAHGHSVIQVGAAGVQGILELVRGLLSLHPRRHTAPQRPGDLSGDRPEAGDELTAQMMCVVAQGKEASLGQFRLEGGMLRVRRTDGKAFHEDPVYASIRAALARLADLIRDPKTPQASFQSPFVDVAAGVPPVIATSHPLGGCPMGTDSSTGVVDEWGRVFRGPSGVYHGLYLADASVIPTALGVNPSLTISAIALRIAEGIVKEMTTP